MTLPEHLICSAALAQFGVRQRFGWRGVIVVALAGIAPDLDSAGKLVDDRLFWEYHHSLGHCLLAVFAISLVATDIGIRWLGSESGRDRRLLFGWCFAAAIAHCLTDSLYWWGVRLLWPFNEWLLEFDLLEYLDLIVLTIWLGGAAATWRFPGRATPIAIAVLTAFGGYVALRFMLPEPTGWLRYLAGEWIYAAPPDTPVLDWW